MSQRKRIGIFTLTHALNYGAFFQMYAMAKYLELQGHEVTVFDCQRSIKFMMLRYISYNPVRQIRKLRMHYMFSKDRRNLKVLRYKGEKLDIAILGSDEIWNIDNPSFEHAPEYFGTNIDAKVKIAYAPSIGYAKPETLSNNSFVRNALSALDLILARDENTRRVAMEIVDTSIPTVADPTILYNRWPEFIGELQNQDSDFILYYGYRSDPVFKSILLEFADRERLPIYSAGFRAHNWCAQNIVCSPKDFLKLVSLAKYVFTDTFHGFLMASLLNKDYCFAAPMQKIQDVAKKLQVDKYALTAKSTQADIAVSLSLDKSERTKRIQLMQEQSMKTLDASIDMLFKSHATRATSI